MAEPIMIKRKRMNCWKVFLLLLACVPLSGQVQSHNVDRLTVLRPEYYQHIGLESQEPLRGAPASVIADTAKKRLSVYETLRNGVEEPQNTKDATRQVEKK
jgi:hypothetical protein